MVRLARLGYFVGLSRTGPPALFTSESAVEARLDRSEWQRVYEECFPRVFRALVAAGARPDEAEDALHDAFEGPAAPCERPVRQGASYMLGAVANWLRGQNAAASAQMPTTRWRTSSAGLSRFEMPNVFGGVFPATVKP